MPSLGTAARSASRIGKPPQSSSNLVCSDASTKSAALGRGTAPVTRPRYRMRVRQVPAHRPSIHRVDLALTVAEVSRPAASYRTKGKLQTDRWRLFLSGFFAVAEAEYWSAAKNGSGLAQFGAIRVLQVWRALSQEGSQCGDQRRSGSSEVYFREGKCWIAEPLWWKARMPRRLHLLRCARLRRAARSCS
jgi:hypothetical protein